MARERKMGDKATNYRVFARRFRPNTFAEVIAQEPITETLANAVATGRVAQAYLFAGPRGVGKTSVARILAKSLNCVTGPTVNPCGVCDNCVSIAAGTDTDVMEIDGASHGLVEDVRRLCERIRYAPAHSRYKIYIIDEVHSISGQAFNALLKTLEEPPPNTVFIFATTRADKVPETIASRCQRFVFRRIGIKDIATKLARIAEAEGIKAEPQALTLLARRAAGSMRDAESLFDQVIAFAGETVTASAVERTLGLVAAEAVRKITRAVLEADDVAVLRAINEMSREGVDLTQATRQITELLRDLLVLAAAPEDADLVDASDDELANLKTLAGAHAPATLLQILHVFLEAAATMTRAFNPRLVLEYASLKAARIKKLLTIEEVVASLGGGATATLQTEVARAAPPEPQPQQEEPTVPKSLIEIWTQVLNGLEKTAPHLRALLASARLISYEHGELQIGFPASHAAVAEKASAPNRREELTAALAATLGTDVKVKFTIDQEVRPEGRDTLFGDAPLVEEIRRRYGGEVIAENEIPSSGDRQDK